MKANHLVTLASDDMSKSGLRCTLTAKQQGCIFTRAWHGYHDVARHPDAPEALIRLMEKHPRGIGYWAWKPFVILKALDDMTEEDDIVIYSDAGVEFIEPVQTVIDKMDQDIFLFGNQHLHAHWCKRDIVEAIMPGTPWDCFTTQAQASVIFFRVNDYTREFVKEWLDWCLFEGGRLIDDSPSRTPNHPEFKENRHDQAILTTMAYREGIKLHEWFVRYEGYTPGRLEGYEREFERPLFFHHRFRNADWEARGIAA